MFKRLPPPKNLDSLIRKREQIKNSFFTQENIVANIIPSLNGYSTRDVTSSQQVIEIMTKVFKSHITSHGVLNVGIEELNAQTIVEYNRVTLDKQEMIQYQEAAEDNNNARVDYIIIANSANRDLTQFPLPTQFRIYLAGTRNDFGISYGGAMPVLKNITEVEVLSATVPNVFNKDPNKYVEPNLIVKMEEINTFTSTTFASGNNILAELKVDNTSISTQPIISVKDIKNYFPRLFDKSSILNNLGQFTVTICTFDGQQLTDIPQDNAQITSGTAGFPLVFTTATPHNLVSGEKVYIKKYVSGSLDDEIINKDFGHVVTNITPTTFSIPVNSQLVGAGGYVIRASFQCSVTMRFKGTA